MTKQIACVSWDDLCSAKDAQANLVLVAQAIVIWAGEQTEQGEWVGGIGEQNQRSAKNLRLHVGVIERARALRCGPEIFPTIWTGYQDMLARVALNPPQRQTVFTAQIIPFDVLQRMLTSTKPAPRLRKPVRNTG